MPEVDRSFLRDLKNLDKRLDAKFNGNHFVITYERGHGEPVNILRVRGEDGGFRQPDRRDLAIIKGGDLEDEKMETRLRKAAYKAEQQRLNERRKVKEMIRDRTKDDKLQLAKAITRLSNSSKGNASFRRIDHKPGKNVVRTAA